MSLFTSLFNKGSNEPQYDFILNYGFNKEDAHSFTTPDNNYTLRKSDHSDKWRLSHNGRGMIEKFEGLMESDMDFVTFLIKQHRSGKGTDMSSRHGN